jgi:hypothetical protein
MNLKSEAIAIMRVVSSLPVGARVTGIAKTEYIQKRRISERRVFAILDQLQTEGMVDRVRLWPGAGGATIWVLTQRGMKCLTEAQH